MNDISVILNVYKRPHTLEKQIDALKNQSIAIKSEDIHVWYNATDVEQFLPKDKNIKTYKCNWNTKFFGRFMIPLICRTRFISLLDDDVLPGVDWHKNCIETMKQINGILGTSGVILHRNLYEPNTKTGWNSIKNNDIVQVDLVGHAWFFKQEWSKFIWDETPILWDNGEDIMFSYLAQKHGIDTFVPPHPANNKKLWGNIGTSWANDKNASCRKPGHIPNRNKICAHCIDNGWKTVNNIKK